MLSLERPRLGSSAPSARRRRRHLGQWVVVAVGAVVILALIIGGLASVGRASRSYLRSVDRSYAAQAAMLVDRSNQTVGQLGSVLGRAPTMDRASLQSSLAGVLQDTESVHISTQQLSPPVPNGGVAPVLTAAMAARVSGVVTIRNAIAGLLDMPPASRAITPGEAEAKLRTAAAQLQASDRLYAEARHRLHGAIGHASLPASVWISKPATWSATSINRLTTRLADSASLAPVTQVEIVPTGVSVSPTPVPAPPPGYSPGAPAGASVVPPTSKLTVTAIVTNSGNVAVTGTAVSASLQPEGAGTAASSTAKVSLRPGASVAVTLPALPVSPKDAYNLTVSLSVPPAQVDRTNTSSTVLLWIAPAT